MKKLKLLSLLALPVVATPIIAMLPSCSSLGSMIKIVSTKDFENTPSKKYGQIKSGGPSLHSLLYGTKSFHHGNYLMFFSVSTNSDVNNFLWGDNHSYTKYGDDKNDQPTNLGDIPFQNMQINESILYDAIQLYYDNFPTPIDDIGIITVTEEDIYQKYGAEYNVDYPERPCTPFDKYNDRDHKVNDKHKSGAYVRHDSAAKEWRSLNNELKALYGVTTVSEGSTYFVAIQCIKGIPLISSIINSVTDTNISSASNFAKWLDANAKKTENWK